MKLLSIGDEVEQGTYEHHARFHRAATFRRNESLVFLVSEEIGSGPLNIVVSDPDFNDSTDRATPLVVGPNSVTFDVHQLTFSDHDHYRSSFGYEHCCDETFNLNVSTFRDSLLEAAHPKSLAFLLDNHRLAHFESGFERSFASQITSGASLLFSGDLAAGTVALKGCGVGLTPSGDDFIAGVLIALSLLQQRHCQDYSLALDSVYEATRGTNLFSNAFLAMARRGRVFETMKNLIASLCLDDTDKVRTCTRKLLAFGGTSGSDLATGFLMTIEDDAAMIRRSNASWISRGNNVELEVGAE